MITSILSCVVIATLFILLYTWAGYPLFLALACKFRRISVRRSSVTPSVTVIVAARNEEKNIAERIANILNLEYPPSSVEVIVGSDGSSDRTAEIVRSFGDERVQLLEFPHSRGRAAVHNDVVKLANGEILVFTDAATRFDRLFLKELVANFADSRVGCVSGVITFGARRGSIIVRQRGLYWSYEYWLRSLESKFGVFACASGPCMAVRKCLYRPLTDASYDVDFITPLDVLNAGALVLQEDEAIAFDEMFSTPAQELRAQIRMVSRNLNGYVDRGILLPSRQDLRFTWSLLSHKVLRWLTPVFLAILFISNSFLALYDRGLVLLGAQIAFYTGAGLGWLCVRTKRQAFFFSGPFAFCLANIGFLLGVVRCFRQERITVY